MGSFSELISLERQKSWFPASAVPPPAFHALSPVLSSVWLGNVYHHDMAFEGMVREFDKIFKDYLFYLCVHA